MLSAQEIIREAESLPAGERIQVVDSLLRGLCPPDPEVERISLGIAERRLAEVREGRSEPVPAEEVFARIRKRFSI